MLSDVTHQLAITQNPQLTFVATVSHICHVIRKLAAVANHEEASQQLWRGVRGELPAVFWVR